MQENLRHSFRDRETCRNVVYLRNKCTEVEQCTIPKELFISIY